MSDYLSKGVSVIMPAFNSENFLEQSVSSVLKQTYTRLELIVVNDGSTDSTQTVLEHIAEDDRRVKVIHSKDNLGGAGARNLALSAARFRYVAFIDSDDFWHPEKLERQLSLLWSKGAQLCYTAIQKVDAYGKPFGAPQAVSESVSYRSLLGNPIIGCSSVLLDYSALDRPLMPEIRKRQDFAFWLSLTRNGAITAGINETLTYYRVRSGSLSSNKLSAAIYTWRVYRSFERLSFMNALPYFISYALRGTRKRMNR